MLIALEIEQTPRPISDDELRRKCAVSEPEPLWMCHGEMRRRVSGLGLVCPVCLDVDPASD